MKDANRPIEWLTKREYIAALLLQGIVSRQHPPDTEDAIHRAVRAADLLLAELQKTTKE